MSSPRLASPRPGRLLGVPSGALLATSAVLALAALAGCDTTVTQGPVCCQTASGAQVTTGVACAELGGTSLATNDVACTGEVPAPPQPICCELPTGGASALLEADCTAAGGTATSADACGTVEVCCETALGPAWTAFGLCPDGAILAEDACGGTADEPICCGVEGAEPQPATPDACEQLGGQQLPDEACGLEPPPGPDVCCLLGPGAPPQTLPEDECTALGGAVAALELCEPGPPPEIVCCDLQGDAMPVLLPEDVCAVEGGVATNPEFCEDVPPPPPEICCFLPTGEAVGMSPEECQGLGGKITPADACEDVDPPAVCCALPGEGFVVVPLDECLGSGGQPSPDPFCEGEPVPEVVCCLFGDEGVLLDGFDLCFEKDGVPAPPEVCEGEPKPEPSVCCQLPDAPAQTLLKSECVAAGGFPVPEPVCDGGGEVVCCLLDTGELLYEDAATCGAEGEIVDLLLCDDVPPAEQVCCQWADGETLLMDPMSCEADGGSPVDDALCGDAPPPPPDGLICCVIDSLGVGVPATEKLCIDSGLGEVAPYELCFEGVDAVICCETEFGTYTYPDTGVCSLVGNPLYEGPCEGGPPPPFEEVCCEFPDGSGLPDGVPLPADECDAVGGLAQPLEQCFAEPVEVCCVTPSGESFVTSAFDCAGLGGVPEDVEACVVGPEPELCCLLPDGAGAPPGVPGIPGIPYEDCLAFGGEPAPIDVCFEPPPADDICCLLPSGGLGVMSPSECAAMMGVEGPLAFCGVAPPPEPELACCQLPGGEPFTATPSECEDEGAEIWADAACEDLPDVCCALDDAGEGAKWSAWVECQAAGGFEVPEPLCDADPGAEVCCQPGLSPGADPYVTSELQCLLVGGVVLGSGDSCGDIAEQACCVVGGVPTVAPVELCEVDGGTFLPFEYCVDPGAEVCCGVLSADGTVTLEVLPVFECTLNGGAVEGEASACAEPEPPADPIVCCALAGTDLTVPLSLCEAIGGEPIFEGPCEGEPAPEPEPDPETEACCYSAVDPDAEPYVAGKGECFETLAIPAPLGFCLGGVTEDEPVCCFEPNLLEEPFESTVGECSAMAYGQTIPELCEPEAICCDGVGTSDFYTCIASGSFPVAYGSCEP